MKKTIGFVLITLLQAFLAVVHVMKEVKEFFVSNGLQFVADAAKALCEFYKNLASWMQLENLGIRPQFATAAACVIGFIAEAIIWFLLFGIIGAIINKIKRNRRRKLMEHPYTLTEEEERRFDPVIYRRHFPIKRILSMILPLGVMLFYFFVRFDTEICKMFGSNNLGFLTIWSDLIKPVSDAFKLNLQGRVYALVTNPNFGWIALANKFIPESLVALEYVIVAIIAIVVLLLWYLLWTLLGLPFRNLAARRRAKRARQKYIDKMTKAEVKAIKRDRKRVSKKGADMLGLESQELDVPEEINDKALNSVVAINRTENEGLSQDVLAHADYIDDISEGVIDLGVSPRSGDSEQKPAIEREINFVDEKEIDIVLEKEPVIEVVEDEEVDDNEVELEEDPFFEKYQPENIDINAIAELGDSSVLQVYEEKEEKEPETVVIKEYVERREENEDIINPYYEEYVEEEKVEVKEKVDEEKAEEEKVEDEKVEETEKVEEVVEDEKRPDIKPISIVRGEKQETKEEDKELAKPINFKPTNKAKKNIKPIDLEKQRNYLELKKYVSSNTKVGGSLTPTEAFSTGTTRVASVVRPLSLKPNKKIKNDNIPVVNKPEDYKEEKPFENARKKMINPIIVRHDDENGRVFEKNGETKKVITPVAPLVKEEKADDKPAEEKLARPIKPIVPKKKALKKPIKPVGVKKKQ